MVMVAQRLECFWNTRTSGLILLDLLSVLVVFPNKIKLKRQKKGFALSTQEVKRKITLSVGKRTCKNLGIPTWRLWHCTHLNPTEMWVRDFVKQWSISILSSKIQWATTDPKKMDKEKMKKAIYSRSGPPLQHFCIWRFSSFQSRTLIIELGNVSQEDLESSFNYKQPVLKKWCNILGLIIWIPSSRIHAQTPS